MIDVKPVCTPMSTTCCLGSVVDAPTCDVSSYHSIIGSLHYLSITQPDVAFATNRLSQFMQVPTVTHMQALK